MGFDTTVEPFQFLQQPLKRWRCPRGHEYEARGAFTVHWKHDPWMNLTTGPLCGICVIDRLNAEFGGLEEITPASSDPPSSSPAPAASSDDPPAT